MSDGLQKEIGDARRALLANLLREKTARAKRVPASLAQRRLWFLDQLEGGSSYNISWATRIKGHLNVGVLRRTLNAIVARHESLRTNFASIDGEPVQIIAPFRELELTTVDLKTLAPSEREAEAHRLAVLSSVQPFNLAQDHLLRTSLFQLDDDEHVFSLTIHHIISDGWSMGVLFREIGTVYSAFAHNQPSPLPELPIQYSDFALWQREWLQNGVLQEQLDYWKKQLAGAPALLELPTDRPRPPIQTFIGADHRKQLPQHLSASLNELSRSEGVTLFMTLLAAFQTLLHRYSHQDEIVVGTPIANRHLRETEDLIGFFVNTLVMRASFSGNPSFRQLLQRTREIALGAYTHQDLPFERLVEELHPERSLSHLPLFQVLFALQNMPQSTMSLPAHELQNFSFDKKTSKFDLALFATESDHGLMLTFEYNTDLFDAARVERMAEHLETLLQGIVSDPDRRISELPLLLESERNQLLIEWNETQAETFQEQCIHRLFEEQVRRTPTSTALVLKDQQLTYGELNARANQLAHYLRSVGIGPEALVGICVERSLEMVVGLLGILKAGGAYVPLDPEYPPERLRFMLEDANAQLVLTQKKLSYMMPESPANLFCLDSDRPLVSTQSEDNPATTTGPENLAYVIYTSGSTGKPKGVGIEHRSAVALLAWARGVFSEEELSGVLASTSICFDLSIFELFVPLSCGGKVLLAENLLHLPSLASAKNVVLINTVPSAMVELLRLGGIPESVQTVNLAGEPLSADLVEKLYEHPQIKKVNDLYGPTEDTTYSTWTVRQRQGPTTIGRPIWGTRAYLLDNNLRPVPIGVPGALYLGGAGLARGYLKRPGLTAQSFIPDQFGAEVGARLYKTGDMARWRADGNIEYLGRIDSQVKLRGFRIELGEIESVIKKHSQVSDAAVVAYEVEPGDRRLVAYVVSEKVVNSNELRQYLRQKLPEYMVPSVIVELEELPLTANGKVDRRALPAPQLSRSDLETQYEAPRTAIEEVLASIWSEILNVDVIGIHDNFFQLGGHSLLATQVISRVRDRFKIQFPLRRLFEYPTIAKLAEAVGQAQSEGKGHSEMQIKARPRDKSTLLENLGNLSAEQIDSLLSEALSKKNANK